MRVGEAARTSLCPPSHGQACSPRARLPALLPGPATAPPDRALEHRGLPARTGRASSETENVKGTFLRSLPARRANRSSSDLTPHSAVPPPSSHLGGFLRFRLILMDLGVSLTL